MCGVGEGDGGRVEERRGSLAGDEECIVSGPEPLPSCAGTSVVLLFSVQREQQRFGYEDQLFFVRQHVCVMCTNCAYL